jgi:hypothetical protein
MKARRPSQRVRDLERRREAEAIYDAIDSVKREAAIDHLMRALALARLAATNAAIVARSALERAMRRHRPPARPKKRIRR